MLLASTEVNNACPSPARSIRALGIPPIAVRSGHVAVSLVEAPSQASGGGSRCARGAWRIHGARDRGSVTSPGVRARRSRHTFRPRTFAAAGARRARPHAGMDRSCRSIALHSASGPPYGPDCTLVGTGNELHTPTQARSDSYLPCPCEPPSGTVGKTRLDQILSRVPSRTGVDGRSALAHARPEDLVGGAVGCD